MSVEIYISNVFPVIYKSAHDQVKLVSYQISGFLDSSKYYADDSQLSLKLIFISSGYLISAVNHVLNRFSY